MGINNDLINGVFEAVGALLLVLNIRGVMRDKTTAGISLWPTIHWTLWGVWNLYYYPSLGQWWSFYAGLGVVLGNTIWLGLVFWYWLNTDIRPFNCCNCGEKLVGDFYLDSHKNCYCGMCAFSKNTYNKEIK